ncbi:GNRR-1 protein [Aphelenchoides avenae]|nr:GNRR-1 protein [Aphelenchus avenae]
MNCTLARPPTLAFNYATLAIVVCYLVVFFLAFVGNTTMFLILFRHHLTKRRRVHSLLLHMTIAHLLVTLIYMPKEVVHNMTVAWWGGDLLCRLCKFFDVFGVALSANILMCLSLDRFYSILFPLYAINAKRNVMRMLTAAWVVAFLSSLPQVYIFRTAQHPCFDWYTQCVSTDVIGLIPPAVTFWFSVLNIFQVYFLPLIVILLCYGSILVSISLKSGTWNNDDGKMNSSILRRTGQDNFERAKNRTLKMTIVVVLAFLLCWTPYTIAMFIHFLRSSATSRPISPLLSKFLYAFAVFNSAISPYLYGYFSFNIRDELRSLSAQGGSSSRAGHVHVDGHATAESGGTTASPRDIG